MTISTELRRAGPYAGNGVSVSFPFSFKVFAPGDLRVVRTDGNGDNALSLNSDYAVTLNANQDGAPGGTVALTAALQAGEQLTILSQVQALQPTELTNQGGFYPQVITRALDRIVILIQQLTERVGRSIVLSPTEGQVTIPTPFARRGGKILGFNAATGAFEVQSGAAFKGDPGGNVLAIGLFSAANGMSIPTGTEMVQTSGHTSVGIGKALYTYRPGLPISIVAQYPRTAFADASGRVFVLSTGDRADLSMYGNPAVGNVLPLLTAAYRDLSDIPANPPIPGAGGFGRGLVTVPKINGFVDGTWAPTSALGLVVAGTSRYSSSLYWALNDGVGIQLAGYYGATFSDMAVVNTFANPVNSIGFKLDGLNGGAYFCLKAVELYGFNIGIDNTQPNGNGDKGYFERTSIIAAIGYRNDGNNQAYGNTWFNCSGSCGIAQFQLGGCGNDVIINFTGNIAGSFIKYPEGSGNPGSSLEPSLTTLIGTRLEQQALPSQGAFANTLVDARESKLLTDQGGSNTRLLSINGWVRAQPENVPDPENSLLAVFGDLDPDTGEYRGSERQGIQLWGGWYTSQVLRFCSRYFGRTTLRNSIRDCVRAPRPDRQQNLGGGFHALTEYRHNENVPLDQYIGGESFEGALDTKAYIGGQHKPGFLIDSSLAPMYGARYGVQVAVGAGKFPAIMTVTGVAVFIRSNPSGTDTQVDVFSDAAFTQLVGTGMVAADRLGLCPIIMNDSSKWISPVGGSVYLRITKPGQGQITFGHPVLFYFPLVGY